MNDIRKISVGANYKDAMSYVVGQKVMNDTHIIHAIKKDSSTNSIKVWIEKDNVVVLWKEFNEFMPISIEYNIDF